MSTFGAYSEVGRLRKALVCRPGLAHLRLTLVEVDAHDPAFKDPSKFVGPVYDREAAARPRQARGWVVKPDGDRWRRVAPSPLPTRIPDSKVIDLLPRRGRWGQKLNPRATSHRRPAISRPSARCPISPG